jgi:hypothetical protein
MTPASLTLGLGNGLDAPFLREAIVKAGNPKTRTWFDLLQTLCHGTHFRNKEIIFCTEFGIQ